MAAKRKRSTPKPKVTFGSACDVVERALASRPSILSDLAKSKRFDLALAALVEALRFNVFSSDGQTISLQRTINQLDRRTQQDGFHALNDWDGKAERFNENTIPVDVASFMVGKTVAPGTEPAVLAILLDYHFLYVLALLALRAWEEGDPNENLDEVTRLIGELSGPRGSGQRFVDDAETLILVATAHYESDEQAYVRLLERVKGLSDAHRIRWALSFAAILGSHLRFGFEVTYGRDMVALRADNFPDYPWLCFSLDTLMQAYALMHDEGVAGPRRDRVVEGLVNGLSPDPRAFVGEPPESLSAFREELSRFRRLFEQYREDLLEEFQQHRPAEGSYSPISFYFNFVHNVLKGEVVDALLRGRAWDLSLNDLLTRFGPHRPAEASPERLIRTLMGYAQEHPDTIRGRPFPVILYDPRWGSRAFADILQRTGEIP